MDDLLPAHLDAVFLQKTAEKVLKDLMSLHLMMVPDKVQIVTPFAFLGLSIAKQVCSLSFKVEIKELYSFSELQQLCGTVNWLKPFLPIPDQKMRHLCSLLEVPTCPPIRVMLTHEARVLLQEVVAILATSSL